MSVSKHELKEGHIRLREACNDLICAVKENPKALHGLIYKPAINERTFKPLPSSYRHMSIMAIIGAVLAKIGLH